MGVKTVIAAAASARLAWSSWRNTDKSATDYSDLSRRPLLPLGSTLTRSNTASSGHSQSPSPRYGATVSGHGSPERLRRESVLTLTRVPEDGTLESENTEGIGGQEEDVSEEEQDLELEEIGLYRGSYPRLLALQGLVPLSSLATFVFLAYLPAIVYPLSHNHKSTYPYPQYIPFPVAELLVSISLWSLTHLSRVPFYTASSSLVSSLIPRWQEELTTILSTALHTTLTTFLRLSAFAVLLIPHFMLYPHTPGPDSEPYTTWRDPAFRRVWWVALGWAAAEVTVGITQGFAALGLYKDALVLPEEEDGILKTIGTPNHLRDISPHTITTSSGGSHLQNASSSAVDVELRTNLRNRENNGRPLGDAIQAQVDRDLDMLLVIKEREELEEVYGMPVIRIPVFISCLQRLNTVLLSLGLTLLLSSAYIRSSISLDAPGSNTNDNTPISITLPVVLIIQFLLYIIHTPLVLPQIGIHTAAYIGLLVSLSSFFAGLGVWEALS